MEKYQENLKEAIRSLQIADHMTYVTFPLVNEQRLLLKIFDEIYKSIRNCVNAILNYEYLYKRVHLYVDNGENMRTFAKCAKSYNLSHEQVKKILEILELNKKHEQSAMEFVKKDRIIILSESLGTQTIDVRKIKEYLILAKELLMRVNEKVKAQIV
ncbi:MAG: hypothetical protein PHH54_00180 [Candidatus Nanoarchaeia archaeon]|nr:hypothetical protein [Candidatus Nanoarchaeia archaeon]MDD5740379.1 hypothetical protein [Candidatus Nanoarchaeia archaeon]